MMTQNTSKPSLLAQAAAIFGVTEKNVPACMYAIGIVDGCVRCGGCGEYSFNYSRGTRCFGCNGKGKVVAKLTKKTLEVARVKVAAGELEAVRAHNRAKREAREAIAPTYALLRAMYSTIAAEYEAAYKARYCTRGAMPTDMPESLYNAQTMNNSLSTAASKIEFAVQRGTRTDSIECLAELRAIIEMLETLNAAWKSSKV